LGKCVDVATYALSCHDFGTLLRAEIATVGRCAAATLRPWSGLQRQARGVGWQDPGLARPRTDMSDDIRERGRERERERERERDHRVSVSVRPL
jgi:hypothetical protein